MSHFVFIYCYLGFPQIAMKVDKNEFFYYYKLTHFHIPVVRIIQTDTFPNPVCHLSFVIVIYKLTHLQVPLVIVTDIIFAHPCCLGGPQTDISPIHVRTSESLVTVIYLLINGQRQTERKKSVLQRSVIHNSIASSFILYADQIV